MAVPMPPPWPQLQMAPATEPKRRRPPQDELFSGPTHRASLTHQSPFHEIYRDIVDPTATANTVDDYHVQEYEAGSSESYSAADTRAENTAAPLDASSPLHRSQTTALSAHAVGMAGATAEISIAPIVNVPIANAIVLNATTLPPRFQAPAPVAPSAAMVDDDDAVTTVVAIPQITHATAQARAHPIMPHATTPLPRFQAPAPSADSTAMADDDDAAIANNSDGAQARGAEDEEVSAAQGIPRPRDWQERTRKARKHWSQRHVWNGKYEGSE